MAIHDADCFCTADHRFDIAQLSAISINTIRDMVVWIAADGSIVFANSSARTYFGRSDPNLINKKIYEIDPGLSEALWRMRWQNVLEHKFDRFESTHKLSDTEIVPVEVSVNLIEHEGKPYSFAIFHDITERKRLQAELQHANATLERLALTDPLSGLGNRREFDRRMEDACAAHRRTGSTLSLMLIDIDYFKAFNDTYGHPEGDVCLRSVADVLRRCVRRDTDSVTRIGGEEFACVLPATHHEGALQLATSVRDAVMALGIPHASSPVAPVLTVSIGVVTTGTVDDPGAMALFKAADTCLYAAKAAGRNRVSHRLLADDAACADERETSARAEATGPLPRAAETA